MPFKAGQSGNPKGRPPKNRALTKLLEQAANQKIELQDGTQVAKKKLVADLAWELAATGQVTFPDGTVVKVESTAEWRDTLKWLYAHIDGPPKAEMDITSGGQRISQITYIEAVPPPDEGVTDDDHSDEA